MPARIGINGFGRMGRLALRAGFDRTDLEWAGVNEIAGDAAMSAHLLEFDSVHGRWNRPTASGDGAIRRSRRRHTLCQRPDDRERPLGRLELRHCPGVHREVQGCQNLGGVS